MLPMKKTGLIFLCALLLTGCAADQDTGNETVPSGTPLEGDAYELFTAEADAMKNASSASYSVKCEYNFLFSDETRSAYLMDGVLETEEESEKAHLTQHISANGLNSSMESWYYDGTLYNTYNGIEYYEKMAFSDVKELMLVPLDVYRFPEQLIEKITAEEDGAGNHIYTIHLKNEEALDFFHGRYDFYGVSEFDGSQIKEAVITDTFSPEGWFVSETVKVTDAFVYQEQPIEATYTSEVIRLKPDETEVVISDELKEKHSAYVASEDIDTSTIDEGDTYDDSPEETVSATFRKRLIGRMGYEEIEGGALQQKFNQNEAYTIDFANKTFIYSNYSINYVYSWQGDLISMGACTYDFKEDRATSECQESTVEKMKEVRNYLIMELYYCGLSIDDLQAETN